MGPLPYAVFSQYPRAATHWWWLLDRHRVVRGSPLALCRGSPDPALDRPQVSMLRTIQLMASDAWCSRRTWMSVVRKSRTRYTAPTAGLHCALRGSPDPALDRPQVSMLCTIQLMAAMRSRCSRRTWMSVVRKMARQVYCADRGSPLRCARVSRPRTRPTAGLHAAHDPVDGQRCLVQSTDMDVRRTEDGAPGTRRPRVSTACARVSRPRTRPTAGLHFSPPKRCHATRGSARALSLVGCGPPALGFALDALVSQRVFDQHGTVLVKEIQRQLPGSLEDVRT